MKRATQCILTTLAFHSKVPRSADYDEHKDMDDVKNSNFAGTGSGQQYQAEKIELGNLSWSTCWFYLKHLTLSAVLATVVFILTSQVLSVLANFWLSRWTEDNAVAAGELAFEDSLQLKITS